MPMVAEGREKICFRETKKYDFHIILGWKSWLLGQTRQNFKEMSI
jgi:hypothetical protein